MSEKIEAVLFDLDGVLLNSKYAFYIQIYDYFKKNGLQPPSYFEVCNRIPKMNLRSFLLSLLPSNLRNPTFVELATKEIDYSYTHDYFSKFATEVPGSAEFISKLKTKGVKTGIITNGSKLMLDTYLHAFSVEVDIALSADHVKPKPNPEGILRALTTLNVNPERVLFCGDSVTDIFACRNAGIRVVSVLSGVGTRTELEKAGADLVIERVDCLKSILKKN